MQHAQTQPEIESGGVTIAESAELPVIVRRTSFFERKLVRQALPWVVIAGMFVSGKFLCASFKFSSLCCRRRRRSLKQCGNGACQFSKIRGKL